jgi:hypothetical protein
MKRISASESFEMTDLVPDVPVVSYSDPEQAAQAAELLGTRGIPAATRLAPSEWVSSLNRIELLVPEKFLDQARRLLHLPHPGGHSSRNPEFRRRVRVVAEELQTAQALRAGGFFAFFAGLVLTGLLRSSWPFVIGFTTAVAGYVVTAGRLRMLRCPACQHVFRTPVFNLPWLMESVARCGHCGFSVAPEMHRPTRSSRR